MRKRIKNTKALSAGEGRQGPAAWPFTSQNLNSNKR